MQRLSIEILKKMFEEKLTRCEVGFMLCASRYQDKGGHIKGLYYREISEEMGCSYPMFYAAMRSLEAKGFISTKKADATDYDITILGNDYRSGAVYKDDRENYKDKPYINTRHDIFYSSDFHKMKAGAQLMAMEFMGLTRLSGGQYKENARNFLEKYMDRLGVQVRTLRIYLTQLRGFFSIGIKDGMYWIRAKKNVYRSGGNTEIENYNEQQIRMTCRRNRIETGKGSEVQDIRDLVKQYGKQCIAAGRDALETVLEAIRRSVNPVWGMSADDKVLMPRLVHKWVRQLLSEEGVSGQKKAEEREEKASVKNSFNNFDQRDYDMTELERQLLNA